MKRLSWILILLSACNAPNKNGLETNVARYFPDALEKDTTFKSFLIKAGEPSLFENQNSSEVYRITFITTASFVSSKVIRLEKNSNDSLFNISGVILPNWIDNYSLTEKKEFKMTMKIVPGYNYWDSIHIKLRECDFWGLPFNDSTCGKGIMDGGSYLFEGKRNGKYQIFYRPNPFNSVCPKHREINELLNTINNITRFGGSESYRFQ